MSSISWIIFDVFQLPSVALRFKLTEEFVYFLILFRVDAFMVFDGNYLRGVEYLLRTPLCLT